jgi:serine/threonine protein kinase
MPPESSVNDTPRNARIGKYEIVSHLATGGMGAVYRALDVDLGRQVALKVLSPEWMAHAVRRERFRREARHSAKLRHENIVTIYEFGEANGTYYLALELVEGTDLQQYIDRKGRLDPDEARFILLQVARALDHAYSQGIIHRDIKPSNILLERPEDRPLAKLTDFGLSREARDDECRVTGAGLTVGTVDYLAPEQARDSGLADIRSDIYSLGCTLFHMLAGQAPFAEGSWTERVFKHIEAEPPDIRQLNPQVPERLTAVMRRMLAKKPDDRYQTPAELLDELLQLDSPAPPTSPPRPAAAATADEPPATKKPVPSRAPAPRRQLRPARSEEPPTDDGSPLLPVSLEQRRAAAGQFERAEEVLATGSHEYAIQLLLSSCALDPANLLYRRTLRRVEKTGSKEGLFGRRLAWLTALPGRTRLKAALRARDYRKVLEYGEKVLARNPHDLGAPMDMAEAANALGLDRLALWLLEQAWQTNPRHTPLNRALARLYEKQGNFSQAIAVWEMVAKADPSDVEAHRKVKDLAAKETIARGNYAELVEGN